MPDLILVEVIRFVDEAAAKYFSVPLQMGRHSILVEKMLNSVQLPEMKESREFAVRNMLAQVDDRQRPGVVLFLQTKNEPLRARFKLFD